MQELTVSKASTCRGKPSAPLGTSAKAVWPLVLLHRPRTRWALAATATPKRKVAGYQPKKRRAKQGDTSPPSPKPLFQAPAFYLSVNAKHFLHWASPAGRRSVETPGDKPTFPVQLLQVSPAPRCLKPDAFWAQESRDMYHFLHD